MALRNKLVFNDLSHVATLTLDLSDGCAVSCDSRLEVATRSGATNIQSLRRANDQFERCVLNAVEGCNATHSMNSQLTDLEEMVEEFRDLLGSGEHSFPQFGQSEFDDGREQTFFVTDHTSQPTQDRNCYAELEPDSRRA